MRAQISTGSYVGTGTYGQSNPTMINCGFKPKMLFIYISKPSFNDSIVASQYTDVLFAGWAEGVTAIQSNSYPPSDLIRFTQLDNGLSFYGNNYPYNNREGIIYYYAALG